MDAADDGRARPDSWKTDPMPAKTARLPFTGSYSPEEYERLRRGLVPSVMEDKWFIVEHGGTLSFHRSWTGVCVYQVRIELAADRRALATSKRAESAGGRLDIESAPGAGTTLRARFALPRPTLN